MSKFNVDQYCIDDVLKTFSKSGKKDKKKKKKGDDRQKLFNKVSHEDRIIGKLARQTYKEIQKGQLVIRIAL